MAAVIVKSADNLKHISEASFPEIFRDNLSDVYAHEDKDIGSILDSRKPATLKELWSKLVSLLQERHEPCRDRSPLTCKDRKKDIIPEILLICRFLTTPTTENPQIHLDSFFSVVSPPEEQPTTLAELIEVVTLMKTEMSLMKSEIVSLKCEDQINKDQINILKSENVQLRSHIRTGLPVPSKCKPRDFTHDTLTEGNTIPDGNNIESDIEANESEAENSDLESVTCLSFPQKIRKVKKLNLVRAAPTYASAFIGNVHPDITKQNIREWICDEHDIKVNISDIEQLTTVGKSNAFKISVPKHKLEKTITGWPDGIKAEPYALKKPKIYAANTTRGNQGSKGRNQSFRKTQRTAPKHNPWSRSDNPHWNAPKHSNWTDQYSFRPNGHC